MQIKMVLTLTVWQPESDEDAVTAELIRYFDLPFAPFPKLKLHMDEVGEWSDSFNDDYLIAPCFEVIDVSYIVRSQTFRITAGDVCENVEELEAHISQLRSNYGFQDDD